MNRTEQFARQMLAPHNPDPPTRPLDAGDERRAAAVLERIVATPRFSVEDRLEPAAAGRRWPSSLAPAPAVLIAAGLVLLVGTSLLAGVIPGGPAAAHAATPPLLTPVVTPGAPAGPVLERAAAAAEVRVVPAPPDGRFRYVRTAEWHLNTAVAGDRAVSRVVPQIRQVWLGEDGSARVIEVEGRAQEAAPPGDAADRAAQAALPDQTAQADADVARYAPGEYAPLDVAGLPADASELRDVLLADEQPEIPDAFELMAALTERLAQQPVPPGVLAGFYRALAREPFVVDLGPVTDRAGRPGVAIGLDSAHSGLLTRYLLIVEPATGVPLGSEEILVNDAGALNVRVPAVIGYTAYLAAGTVNSESDSKPTAAS